MEYVLNGRRKMWVWTLGLSLVASARGELMHDWVQRVPTGTTLYSGLADTAVDAAGNTYAVGNAGVSFNVDGLVVKCGPDGTVLWSRVYDGPAAGHDTLSGIALGSDGAVYATGATPGAGGYADLLLLKYDADSGALLWSRTYNGGPFTADAGLRAATDDEGNVYAGGHTVGDGTDCLTVKYDSGGNLLWSRTWDGPASAPFSGESVRGIAVDPSGDVIMMTAGVMASLHPDYVVIKYASSDGATLWTTNWGDVGGQTPFDLALDGDGNAYVTGVAFNGIDMFGTIKVAGSDGTVLWSAYDSDGAHNGATGIALDGDGGVYITGSADPDGDESNFNDNFFTVKRDAMSGAFIWSHRYGDNCVGCFDAPGDVIVDRVGNVFVVGYSSSAPYSGDQLLLMLDDATGDEVDRGVVAGAPTEIIGGGLLRLDAPGNLYIGGEFYDVNSGAIDMALVRYPSQFVPTGDGDGDGDVDVFDFSMFHACMTGPDGGAAPAGCESFDFDFDADVDLVDWTAFQRFFTG